MKQKLYLLLILCIISSAILIQVNGDEVLDEVLDKKQLKLDLDYLNNTVNGLISAVENLSKTYANQNILKDVNERQTNWENISQEQMKLLQEINEKLTKSHEKVKTMEKELPTIKEYTEVINQIVNKKSPRLPMEVILGLTTANKTELT